MCSLNNNMSEYKVDYKSINEEWDALKVLDNSKPNWDKKWLFVYNLTLQYAKAMLARQKRYIEDIDDRVMDQVARAMERMRDDGWVMSSAKYCTMLATAAICNRSAQEKFEDRIRNDIENLNQWNSDSITDDEWM